MATLMIGCASRSPLLPVDAVAADQLWAVRHAQLSVLDSWELRGRIAVKSAQDSWSANLHWQQQSAAFDIRFSSLLGQRLAQLKGGAESAALHLPDDRVLTAANISALLDAELGWQVPMDGLRYWVVGMPVPGLDLRRGLDAQGRLAWLEQSGWLIEYSRYRLAKTLEVPKKMVLTRGNLRVRLVIDRWQPVSEVSGLMTVPGSGSAVVKGR